jgi:hypothetical protein
MNVLCPTGRKNNCFTHCMCCLEVLPAVVVVVICSLFNNFIVPLQQKECKSNTTLETIKQLKAILQIFHLVCRYHHFRGICCHKFQDRMVFLFFQSEDGRSRMLLNLGTYLPTYKLCGFSPQANYTDRATAACRRSWCQL